MPPAFHNAPWTETPSNICTGLLLQLTFSNICQERSKLLKSRSLKGLLESFQLNQSGQIPEQKCCFWVFANLISLLKTDQLETTENRERQKKTEMHLKQTHQIVGIPSLCVNTV